MAEQTNKEVEDDNALTVGRIDAIEEVFEAFILGEDHGIDMDGLETLDEIKRRMKCHINMKSNQKEKLIQKISGLGDIDKKKRVNLMKMVKAVRDMFPSNVDMRVTTRQNMVEELLSKDGTTENIRQDCDVRLASLNEKECCLLVAGESSAGKSSLLNLILGEELLPSHMLPCTSTITIIKYSHRRCAKILYTDGHMDNIENLDKEGLQLLQERAYFTNKTDPSKQKEVYERRKQGHDVAEIQVFLPLQLLKTGLVLVDTPGIGYIEFLENYVMEYIYSHQILGFMFVIITENALSVEEDMTGLVLVDTPGIGENEFLENYLMEYIYSHQILGFMYVIMTDNALGVAEDRLVNLMSLIIKSQKNSKDIIKFDPNAALFVCNRWDMVQANQQTAVRKNVLKQLAKCWPEFDDTNAVFFSTSNAKREILSNENYATDDYIALLHGIHKLVDTSLDKRINASYKWLGTVLQRSIHYLRTMVNRLDMSEKKREDQSLQAKQKLKALRQRSEDVVRKLYQDAEEAVKHVCLQVYDYLKTPQAKMKLTSNWGKKEGELPDMDFASVSWSWAKERIEAAFDDRFADLLQEWDKDEQNIQSIEKKLFREAKLNLCELEHELADIERKVHDSDTVSLASNMSKSNLLTSFCRSLEDFDTEDLPDMDYGNVKLFRRLKKFVGKMYKKKQDEAKLMQFIKDPAAVAKKRSEKLLECMMKNKEDRLEIFVRDLMQRPFHYISHLESKIPNMVKSNMTLLEKFEKDLIDEAKSRVHYIAAMEKIEKIRRDLIDYGEDHFFANDFEVEDIVLVKRPREVKYRSMRDMLHFRHSVEENEYMKIPYGLWHTVQLGVIHRGSETQSLAVKLYSSKAKIENPLQEVAKLRCLLNNDVCTAEFLGIYQQKDIAAPALIYSGNLISLKHYREGAEHFDYKMEVKIQNELLTALQYIHSKGLVHMELRTTTLTLKETGEVKITGACLPRQPDFPSSDYSKFEVGDFVYLAPEVIRHRGLYIAPADMYSFALLVLELRNKNLKVFADKKNLPLSKFKNLCPREVLKGEIYNIPYPEVFQNLLSECLDEDITKRPDAAKVYEVLQEVGRSRVRKTASVSHIWKRGSYKKH